MLFDLRGRRRHVVKVVYAILAVLMGASLFLVVGPVNIGELFGGSSASSGSSAVFEEQAERIEHRLAKSPKNEQLLLALTRANINAGNALVEVDPATGARSATPEAKAQYEAAASAWSRYLKQAGNKASPSLALLAASAFFTMATNSTSYKEVFEDLDRAAQAQGLVAAARPNVGTYTSLAYYEYLDGNFAAARKATKQAESLTKSKSEKKEIAKQAKALLKQGKEIQKQAREFAKAERGKGKEALEQPFTGLGGTSGVTP